MRPQLRNQARQRMSPPNWEIVAELALCTGIPTQTPYNWRGLWQKQGQHVPATTQAAGAVKRSRQADRYEPGCRPEWHLPRCFLP